MSTLAELNDDTRRAMGLALGSHTITVTTFGGIADGEIITVHGIILTQKDSATTEFAGYIAETSNNATAANIADLINAVFDSTTGISASDSGAVVTVTGARSVTTDIDSTDITISTASTQDEPPTTTDIAQWVLDAQLDIVNKLLDPALTSGDAGLSEVVSLADSSGTSVELAKPTDMQRPVEVRAQIGSDSQLYRLIRVTPRDMLGIREGKSDFYKVDPADGADKYWSMFDDKIQFSAAPVTGADKSTIQYIKDPQETFGSECDLPDNLQYLVVKYASAQGYKQRQNMNLFSMIFQEYAADIGGINARIQLGVGI